MDEQYYVLESGRFCKQKGAILVRVKEGKVEGIVGDFELSGGDCNLKDGELVANRECSLRKINKVEAEILQQDYQKAQNLRFLPIIAECGEMGLGGGMKRAL